MKAALLDFMGKTFYGNTIVAWLTALAIIVLAVVAGKTLYWIFQNGARRLTAKTKTRLDDIILDMIEEPLVVILTVFGFWLAFDTLEFESESASTFIGNAMQVAITLTVAWLAARLIDALIQEYLVPLADKSETDLDDQLLPILRKGAKLTIWVLAVIVALDNAGQDVGALLAGLGVGGLALAIAAQDTVGNIFGGFTIFADRPFVIGDRVRIQGYDGLIRDIGIRSSRLETRDGAIVTIPNSAFTKSAVENITAGTAGRRVVTELGLVYGTPPEKMERAIEILGEIAAATEGVGEDVNLSFSSFGDSALVIRLAYFVLPGSSFRGVQSAVNFATLRQLGAEGMEFAYPTRTIYTVGGGAA